jgi:hypothetical protein
MEANLARLSGAHRPSRAPIGGSVQLAVVIIYAQWHCSVGFVSNNSI